jgi:hypothetical protein
MGSEWEGKEAEGMRYREIWGATDTEKQDYVERATSTNTERIPQRMKQGR